MNAFNDNITILIQGPPNPRSLDHIDEYRKLGNVLVSCWDDNIPKCDVPVVSGPLPQQSYYSNTPNKTFSYQVHSIYNGLRAVKTDYVIRTRSDEFYNLSPLIDKYNFRDDVILCGNIFFKAWSCYSFHMGDHLFIGRTDVLREAYHNLVSNVLRYNNKGCAERSSSYAILDAFHEPWTKEAFVSHFDVMDINALKPFCARWNTVDRDFDNSFIFDDVITKISEL